jgi:hypothetical protein
VLTAWFSLTPSRHGLGVCNPWVSAIPAIPPRDSPEHGPGIVWVSAIPPNTDPALSGCLQSLGVCDPLGVCNPGCLQSLDPWLDVTIKGAVVAPAELNSRTAPPSSAS